MLPYRTVLFDFDYTLVDSSRGIVASVNAALTALDYPVPKPEAVCQTIGLSLNETFVRLTGCLDQGQAARFTQLFKAKADAVMVGQTVLYPGVRETLAKLRSRQIRTGIVTTKYHYRIDQILVRFGAAELINAIVGAEDVNRPNRIRREFIWRCGGWKVHPKQRCMWVTVSSMRWPPARLELHLWLC